MFHGIAVSLGGSRYRDEIREEHEHYTIMHNHTCERHLLPSLRQVDYKISEMFRRFWKLLCLCVSFRSFFAGMWHACDSCQELESVVFPQTKQML